MSATALDQRISTSNTAARVGAERAAQGSASISEHLREMRVQQLGCFADTLADRLSSDDVNTRRGAMSELTERARELGLSREDAAAAAERVWRGGQQRMPGAMPDFRRDQFCTGIGPGVMPRLGGGQGLQQLLDGIRPNRR